MVEWDLAKVGFSAEGLIIRSDGYSKNLLTVFSTPDHIWGAILESILVILSDFARLETETQEAENSAASTYEKFMNEANEDVAVKETEIQHKSNKKDTCEENIRDLNKNLKLTQTELDKALEYYEKLKAECVDLGVSCSEAKLTDCTHKMVGKCNLMGYALCERPCGSM